MNNPNPINTEVIRRAFLSREVEQRVGNTKVGCALVVFLMPLGSLLDLFVYEEEVWPFFRLRLICSGITAVIWAVLFTDFGKRIARWLSIIVPLLPASFIAVMIALKEGFASPYYAGINLVLLAVGVVLHWTTLESTVAVLLALAMYLVAGFLHGPPLPPADIMVNNFYFITLMDIIVVVGTYFQHRAREREFAARFELASNKQILEVSNQKLDQRNRELADAYQKLTEQESQIVQSQKMASVGQMSAGIIHEINNPLNFATTGLFALKKKARQLPIPERAEYEDIVNDIEDGISRVKNIVSDLRTFTHPNTDILDQVLVSDVVASALRFLSNELKDKAVVKLDLQADQAVLANKNKLIHLFVNLIQNSLDALRTKSFPNGEQPTIWIEGRVENGANYLVVRDNGPGIPVDHVDKIYDPFFTTKAVGEGMGLGLSMCSRIMKDSQGKISVRTEKGKFCEFTLEFPDKT